MINNQKVFIIDYYRVVMITSVLAAIIAGFGLDWLAGLIAAKIRHPDIRLIRILEIGTLSAFLILSFWYTERPDWMNLTTASPAGNGIIISPSAPATEYLTDEDMRIFGGMSGKRFVAPPWKGLTIGAATANYPTQSKPSTISSHLFDYKDFLNLDCPAQQEILEEKMVDYLYIRRLDCQKFIKVGQSAEGLILYRYAR